MAGPAGDGKRTVLFFRDFRRFHGGHLKIWDYFNHVRASPEFTPRIAFSERTRWGEDNPWEDAREFAVDTPGAIERPDVFFVAGRDWSAMDAHPAAGDGVPVVNLIQGVRHADPASTRFEYLGRRAIRICVSDQVAEAVRETGATEGPVLVIPNGLDLSSLPEAPAEPSADLVIVAVKRPELGERLQDRLERDGRRVDALAEPLPREEFLSQIAAARVALFLPLDEEGFYLPALEAMAIGRLVVCPDCVGNRSFCVPGRNCFRPSYDATALVDAAEEALGLDPGRRDELLTAGRVTAAQHSLDAERSAFLEVLHGINEKW